MKTFDRQHSSAGTVTETGVSKGRRHLLLLGMALTGAGIIGRILHLPPRTSGQAFRDSGLSRHEASFYATHDTGDR